MSEMKAKEAIKELNILKKLVLEETKEINDDSKASRSLENTQKILKVQEFTKTMERFDIKNGTGEGKLELVNRKDQENKNNIDYTIINDQTKTPITSITTDKALNPGDKNLNTPEKDSQFDFPSIFNPKPETILEIPKEALSINQDSITAQVEIPKRTRTKDEYMIKIQSYYKMHKTRQNYLKLKNSAIKLQRYVKMKQVKDLFDVIRSAIIFIQANYRGFKARKLLKM